MSQINYQVAKLMLVFANEEHIRCDQIRNDIYTKICAGYRDASFQHSGDAVYHSPILDVEETEMHMYRVLGTEFIILAMYLKALIEEADSAYKIEIAQSNN